MAPKLPVFFNETDGLLPVGIVKYNPDGTEAYSVLMIYATHDGGHTWQANPTVVENVAQVENPSIDVDFVSAQQAFIPCEDDLCVTQDSEQTWQILHSNLHFAYGDGIEYVTMFHFVSPTMGWALTSNGSLTALWKTVDGGVTWVKLEPGLVQ